MTGIWSKCWLLAVLLFTLNACQFVPNHPTIQGLPSTLAKQHYDDMQVEVFWQNKSFAFLLSQQQIKENQWQIYALTLSGQVLFELHFDGQALVVVYKHPSLAKLPVEFLLQDIWWATLPKIQVQRAITPLGLVLSEGDDWRQISKADKIRLMVSHQNEQIRIENQQVPYRLLLSQTNQTLLQ